LPYPPLYTYEIMKDYKKNGNVYSASDDDCQAMNLLKRRSHSPSMRPAFYRLIKRAADVLQALVLGIIALPILVTIALISLVVQGWPPLYISERCVKPSKTIKVIKLRTMVKDATSGKYRLVERFMHNGYLNVPPDCEVYTPLGRWLERYQLVELPQIFNILFHGLSWVGNRPLPLSNNELLKQYPGWEERYDAPCGITGISQVVGKHNLEADKRLLLERLYAHVYTHGNIVKCDFLIVLATFRLIWAGKPLEYREACKLMQQCFI